jgi:hypothetical protein
MAYSVIKKPSDYFNTITTTGGAKSVTGVGFQPDWVWSKRRDDTSDHHINDVVRGSSKLIYANATTAEQTNANFLTSFDSDGFTTGSNYWNSSANIVAWNWLANGAGVANTDGSISSTVSANTTSGFSIVKYEASANATIGHGLGVKPAMVITKSRDDATNWASWHKDLTGGNEEDRYFNLNTSGAGDTYTDYWGTGGFTSSFFGVSNTGFHNNSNSMIAYCFNDVQGYSKFGSYTGNGSADGTFVYTGFKPAFVFIKNTTLGNRGVMYDNKRLGYNPNNYSLGADVNLAEESSAWTLIDTYSNGFKCRSTDGSQNASGANYIYMAFAEEPLVGDNPATAR